MKIWISPKLFVNTPLPPQSVDPKTGINSPTLSPFFLFISILPKLTPKSLDLGFDPSTGVYILQES